LIRLNKKEYDRNLFVQAGFSHYDLYFLDGSVPPESILKRFLDIAESEEGVIASMQTQTHYFINLL
jgi:cell division cycle 14